jgi:hypothetical protein
LGERIRIMGKYSHLRGKLPAPPSEPGHAARVKSDYNAFCGYTTEALCAWLVEYRSQLESLEEDAKKRKARIEAIERILVLRTETCTNVAPVRTEQGLFSVKDTPEVVIENPKAFNAWVRDNQLLDEIPCVPVTKAAEWAKERLLDGKPLPEGVSVYMRSTIKFTPATTNSTNQQDKEKGTNDKEQ